jgi:hypothetical protein
MWNTTKLMYEEVLIALMMEAVCTSETSVYFNEIIRRDALGDSSPY